MKLFGGNCGFLPEWVELEKKDGKWRRLGLDCGKDRLCSVYKIFNAQLIKFDGVIEK